MAIRDSPYEERESVILRDHPCEKNIAVTVRDHPCEKKRETPCGKKRTVILRDYPCEKKRDTPCEEALDHEHCETLDFISIQASGTHIIKDSKAFRFVHVVCGRKKLDDVMALYEYLPQNDETSGSFESSDKLLNDIWNVSAYTLDLTTREFFMDGIKRDRWTWSGDAIQSYLMNYYLHLIMHFKINLK